MSTSDFDSTTLKPVSFITSKLVSLALKLFPFALKLKSSSLLIIKGQGGPEGPEKSFESFESSSEIGGKGKGRRR
jgi:hypothetical protein